MKLFWSYTQDNLLSYICAEILSFSVVPVYVYFIFSKLCYVSPASSRYFNLHEVHLRRAYEACHELVHGMVIEVLRSVYLMHESVLHYHNPVSHGHGLGLVVRNVYEGRAKPLVKLAYLAPHRCTELCIEVGKRLVKKEYLWVSYHGSSKRDSLPLTSRKRFWLSVEQMLYIKYLCSFSYPFVDLVLFHFLELEGESHIFVD